MPFLNIFLFLSELLPSSLMELQSAYTSRWRSRSFCRCYLFEVTSLLHPVQLVLLPLDFTRCTSPWASMWLCPRRARPLAFVQTSSPGATLCYLQGWVLNRQSAQATQATPHLSCLRSQCQNLKRRPFLPYLNYTQLGLKT